MAGNKLLSNEILQKIETIAEQVSVREGCRLYDVEFTNGFGGRTLRVFIDKSVEGGATLDDCANVSRGINLLLDVEDLVPGTKYNLEVSTPGIERVLKKEWHYLAVVGKKIWLKLNQSLQGLGVQSKKYAGYKQFSEVLQAANSQGITLQLEDEQILIPYDHIEKSHVVYEFQETKGKKKQ